MRPESENGPAQGPTRPVPPEVKKDPREEYRQHLVLAEQKAQEDYDKTIVALSGGGLGISLLFIEKVVGSGQTTALWVLCSGWVCWTASIGAVLASYFTSRLALRKAMKQCDDEHLPLPRQPGGRMARFTETLNVLSGLLFVAGAALVCWFSIANFEGRNG